MRLFLELWGCFILILGVPLIIMCYRLHFYFLMGFNLMTTLLGLYFTYKLLEYHESHKDKSTVD